MESKQVIFGKIINNIKDIIGLLPSIVIILILWDYNWAGRVNVQLLKNDEAGKR